ncbi:Capn15 [Symbiodinium natans]|uniref:Capn15 protein n=1 Tax=Symbiodinium natans TaxID=878477 RepID=A0A812UUG9_9DINO|nr:Capn15 [Symbiodinium natans]
MAEVLVSLDAIQRELENAARHGNERHEVFGKVSPEAQRVLSACGIRRGTRGFTARTPSSVEVLRAACGIVRQLLLSLEEDAPAAQQREPVAPSAGSGDRPRGHLPHEDESRRTPKSASPQPDMSPAEEDTTDAEASHPGAGSPLSPEDVAPEAPAEQLPLATAAFEPKVVSFERFHAEKFRVSAEQLGAIERACAERGETYVDPQFPPTAASLYLSAEEEHTWQCLSCHTHSRLPPVPPLASSREEADKQEQDFRNKVRCQGCGQLAHYVVQVRYFTRPTQWLRPGHTCEGCQLIWSQLHNGNELAATMCTHYLRDSVSQVLGTPWKVIREAARPEDVCQGALGNCWFAGALSVVAQMPDLIGRICVTKDLRPHGVYQLRLCHAGEWLDLVVDDYFPTSQVSEGFTDGQTIRFSRGGSLCYLGGARRQLWPPLVEKAAAKLFGCYGALKGGTFAEALALFTGYPTQRLRLYVPAAARREKEEKRQARHQQRMRLLLGGADVPAEQSEDSDDDDDDLTWSKLLSCKEAGYLLGAGCSEEGCEKSKTHIVEEMGLQAPHAYGILDFAEVAIEGKTARLVKIRNPWGQNAPRTWKGKWGKDWSGWTPELQKQLGVINSSGVLMDDPMSIFWMAFEDVKDRHRSCCIACVPSTKHAMVLWPGILCASGDLPSSSQLARGSPESSRNHERTAASCAKQKHRRTVRNNQTLRNLARKPAVEPLCRRHHLLSLDQALHPFGAPDLEVALCPVGVRGFRV